MWLPLPYAIPFISHYDQSIGRQWLFIHVFFPSRNVPNTGVSPSDRIKIGEGSIMYFHPCNSTHSGLYGLRVIYIYRILREQIICSMPNQSAKRIMVPRFPGSCTSSNARQSDERTASGSKSILWLFENSRSTCWGVFNKLARERSSCETSTSSLASIPGCS